MKPNTHDFDTVPTIYMHEALTPALLRQIYAEDQLQVKNPVIIIFAWLKKIVLGNVTHAN